MKMTKTLLVAAAAAALSWGLPANAQNFPDKPIKIIMPYPAGVGPDIQMRLVAEKLKQYWGQPVVVENKPGGNGWIAVEAVKKAPADGYTLLQTDNLQFGLQPTVFKNFPFDVAKDFATVAPLYTTHYFVCVSADSKWNSVADMMAAAQAANKAGKPLSYGSSGYASHMHLGGIMLENGADTKMNHVPYKETPQVFVSVASGDLDWASETKNYTDFELRAWVGLFAPAGTPKAVVEKINEGVKRALAEQDVRDKMATIGMAPWAGSAAELATAIKDDEKLFGGIAKRENIRID